MQPLRPTIQIYAADGTALAEVIAESGSKLTANLMQDNYITLNFTLEEVVRFVRGCYCLIPTCADRTMPVRYVVVEEVTPTFDNATGGYKYQMRLDAWYQSWSRYKFSLAPAYGAVQTDFSYTQTVSEHVRLIAEQLRVLSARDASIKAPTAYRIHYLDRTDTFALAEVADARVSINNVTYPATFLPDGAESGEAAKVIVAGGSNPLWQLVHSEPIPDGERVNPDTNEAAYLLDDTIKMVSYTDISIVEAINEMCGEQSFNCEWWMEDDVLNFGRCEYGTAMNLARGNQLSQVERSKASQDYGTRLIAFGSDRNVPSRYRKFVALQATNVTNTKDSAYEEKYDSFSEEKEVVTASAGQQVSITYVLHSSESLQVDNGLSTDLSFSVGNVYDNYGTTERIEVELWHGDRENGGKMIGSSAEDDDSLDYEGEVYADIDDQERDLYFYVTMTGRSGAKGDGTYAYYPYMQAGYSFWLYNTLKQVLFDTNHKVTSENFFPAYRCAQVFRIGNVGNDQVHYHVDFNEQGQPYITLTGRDYDPQYRGLGYADYYSPSAVGLVYTWRYRATINIELEGQPTYPGIQNRISQVAIYTGPFGNMHFRDALDEGRYTVEGEIDVSRQERAVTSAELTSIVALVPAGVTATITIIDIQWRITSDGFNTSTNKEEMAQNAIAVTKISHADERGNAVGSSYDAYVKTDGTIEIDSRLPFSQGDRFTLDGLRNETIKLSWFTDKYGESAVCSYARRLMLPEETCPQNYIDSPRIQDEGVTRQNEVVEVIKVFDDIYPEQTLIPYAVECYPGEHKIIDDDGSEQIVHVRRYAMYIKKNDFPFSEQYIPSGMTLQCIFQTGTLSGCGFELGYAGTVLLSDIAPQGETDTRYCKFYIIPNSNYGVELPNETLHPVGTYYADRFTNNQAPFVAQTTADKLIMINYLSSALTEFGYVAAAEARLETAARAYLDKISLDAAEYTATLANDYAEKLYREGTGYPAIGQKVALTDATYFDQPRETRVIGIERRLDIPYDALVLKLGESLRYSRTKDIVKQLKQL